MMKSIYHWWLGNSIALTPEELEVTIGAQIDGEEGFGLYDELRLQIFEKEYAMQREVLDLIVKLHDYSLEMDRVGSTKFAAKARDLIVYLDNKYLPGHYGKKD